VEAVDFDSFEVLSFDCYGTLIDWETGLLDELRQILDAHGASAGNEELLELYGASETEIESGPYRPYAEVLASVLRRIGDRLGFAPTDEESRRFAASVGGWPPFDDSPAALARLGERFGLAVITNCDDDLFAGSSERLGVAFDWVVTAQQARAYKPSHRIFELAFERIARPRERILHVAQSVYHDHVPAKELGMTTVWIDRRGDKAGSGATPPAQAAPDLTLGDLATLAELASRR
jgi:2-haloacid dehalogenase